MVVLCLKPFFVSFFVLFFVSEIESFLEFAPSIAVTDYADLLPHILQGGVQINIDVVESIRINSIEIS